MNILLLIALLTTGTLLLNFPAIAQETSVQKYQSSRVLKKARNQKTLVWGLKEDDLFVSGTSGTGKLKGFCIDLVDLLEKYLKQENFVQEPFKVHPEKIETIERFQFTQQKKFDGECGTNSIRDDIPGITFSKSFARTPTKVLSYPSKDEKFSNHKEKLKIGIVRGSTTEKRVNSYYDINVEIEKYPSRTLAIDALISGEIDGFANDEIILKAMLKEPEYSQEGLYIRPEKLGEENYGLVLPDDDKEWVEIINKFLDEKTDEIEKLRKKYFEYEVSIDWKFISLALLVLPSFGLIQLVRRRNTEREQKPKPYKSSTFARGYALLIGVGETAYPHWSLPVSVKDVLALNEVLVNPNFCGYPNNPEHIRLLHDEGATRSKILEGLRWLKEQVQTDPDATAIVYYSGHGWLNQSQNRYYLVPHDINPFNLESSALSADEFTDALRQIKCERLLTIVDSCHAAGMATAKHSPLGFEETPLPKSVINNLRQGKGRVVFTSSQGEQSSWIRPDRQMSIYTYHLIEALKGKGNHPHENVVKVSHLMQYISDRVPKSALSMCNEKQTPYFSFETEDFAVALVNNRRS
ncbi:caspase family protein [Scytonema sp. NUACC26]|uniref:caspase family protein n=1 Tax=Scytonema sp. NUACC26 TaxID=3140176 RepID=UPI0034DB8CF1